MADQASPNKSFLQKVIFIIKFLEIRLRFVMMLLVTALLVGYWDWMENYWERWTRGKVEVAKTQSDTEYYCGMHPFVVRETPGLCPVCGMNLDKRKRGAPVQLPEGVLARVQVSPDRIMQAGVQVEPAQYRLLGKTVRAYGIVEMDETKTARITMRFPGRIDELIVNQVGVDVKQGEPLAKIYSPTFLAITQEYVHALESKREAESDSASTEDSRKFAVSLVESTQRRLRLAGFKPEQLNEVNGNSKPQDHITFFSPLSGTVVEKNVLVGDTLSEGMTLYTVADLSRLWVQVQIAEADVDAVRVGMPVEVTSVASPGTIFYGNVDLIYPTVNSESRSIKARLSVANRDGRLKPGMFVNAVVRAPLGRYGEIGSKDEPKLEAAQTVETTHSGYPLDYCVVTGAKLGDMGDPVERKYKERTVKFCCEGCIPKFEKEPDKFLKLIDEAAAKLASLAGEGARWAEGYACGMHPDLLQAEPGKCRICACGMETTKWRIEKSISVPETAVIDTGAQQIIYIESSPGIYDSRAISLGPRSGKYYQVLDGLKPGDRIVTRGSFLIDAEARLNPSAVAVKTPSAAVAHEHGGAEHEESKSKDDSHKH